MWINVVLTWTHTSCRIFCHSLCIAAILLWPGVYAVVSCITGSLCVRECVLLLVGASTHELLHVSWLIDSSIPVTCFITQGDRCWTIKEWVCVCVCLYRPVNSSWTTIMECWVKEFGTTSKCSYLRMTLIECSQGGLIDRPGPVVGDSSLDGDKNIDCIYEVILWQRFKRHLKDWVCFQDRRGK